MIQDTSPRCFQCGSKLILLEKVTSHPEGALFPQTTTTYRCSNKSCQEEIDRQTTKRIDLQKERLVASQKRIEDRAAKEKLMH